MPNIAVILKGEIARVARKIARAETSQLKQASSHLRSENAALKRRIAELEHAMKQLAKAERTTSQATPPAPVSRRFSAKGLTAQRVRLGLSVADLAKLVGVTAQSVYKWEDGRSKPRSRQLSKIAQLRSMGKKEVQARLPAHT